MPLTKPSGNMFPGDFVDYCLSYLVGGCMYQCRYCYVPTIRKRYRRKDDDMPYWYDMPYRTKKVHVPKGRIFVNHTTDGFAANLPSSWIEDYLENLWYWYNANNRENTFIFLTKNPERLGRFNYIFKRFPQEALLFGITLESNTLACQPIKFNRDENYHPLGLVDFTKAQVPYQRADAFFDFIDSTGYNSFISIEPILKFGDIDFAKMIYGLMPQLIFIGADSKKTEYISEPAAEEIIHLIGWVRENMPITEIRLKDNLKRLIPDDYDRLVSELAFAEGIPVPFEPNEAESQRLLEYKNLSDKELEVS